MSTNKKIAIEFEDKAIIEVLGVKHSRGARVLAEEGIIKISDLIGAPKNLRRYRGLSIEAIAVLANFVFGTKAGVDPFVKIVELHQD